MLSVNGSTLYVKAFSNENCSGDPLQTASTMLGFCNSNPNSYSGVFRLAQTENPAAGSPPLLTYMYAISPDACSDITQNVLQSLIPDICYLNAEGNSYKFVSCNSSTYTMTEFYGANCVSAEFNVTTYDIPEACTPFEGGSYQTVQCFNPEGIFDVYLTS